MSPRDHERWGTFTQSYQDNKFTMSGSMRRRAMVSLRSHHGHSRDAFVERPEMFASPTTAMELDADNIDPYPEYHCVVHGAKIKEEQRLRTSTRLDNHLGKRISRSQADESHLT
eukprot:12405497-Karenia_brevis.AAC.1